MGVDGLSLTVSEGEVVALGVTRVVADHRHRRVAGRALPLSFVSNTFNNTVDLPAAMSAVGWTFPLRHATAAAVTATSGGALDASWFGHLGVLLGWAAIGAVGARLFLRWEPRP